MGILATVTLVEHQTQRTSSPTTAYYINIEKVVLKMAEDQRDEVGLYNEDGTERNNDVVDYIKYVYADDSAFLFQQANYEKIEALFKGKGNDPSLLGEDINEMLAAKNGGAGADQTDAFGGDGTDAKPAKKTRTPNPIRQMQKASSKLIVSGAKQLRNTNFGACAIVVSQRAAVVAYLNATPEHLDIAKKTTTNDASVATTRFGVKSFAPGAVKGMAVAVPVYAIEEVRKYATCDDPDACNPARANEESQPYAVELMSTAHFTETFLSLEAAGSVREADELWAPCVKKAYHHASKSYNIKAYPTVEEVNKTDGNDDIVAGKNAIYISIAYRKQDGKNVTVSRAKHTLRSKLQAPGNCISAKEYTYIDLKAVYDAAEAAELTSLYFGRYNTLKYKGTSLLATIADDDSDIIITVDPTTGNKTIAKTNFFATNANESALNQDIDHWFDRTADGDFVKFSPIGKQLVKRVGYIVKSKGTASSKVDFKELQVEQDATGTAYTLDFDGRYKKIGDACKAYHVSIDAAELIRWFKENGVLRGEGTGTGRARSKAVKPMGINAFGFARTRNSDALKSALEATA